MDRPERKTVRLNGYDYNAPGYYFLTICTKEKKKLLCDIVGTGVLDGPKIRLTAYGRIAEKHLQNMSDFYDDLKVEKYVIMPNHIHLLIHLLPDDSGPSGGPLQNKDDHKSLKRPVPTNSKISKFVGTFKRFCNKEYGQNIWQARSYDHIIRGEEDHREIWEYIESNPAKWLQDRFYLE